MPEGAEVKLYSLDLHHFIQGKHLESVKVLSGRYTKKPIDRLEEVKSKLPLKVNKVDAYGKFLYWVLEKDNYLFSTLGMTGAWTTKKSKHSRVEFSFSDGSIVYYTDVRNFGTLSFQVGEEKLEKKIKNLGPDMLSERVCLASFKERLLKKKNWTIAKAIMDQSVISGVGNYVKAESLYLAKISPHRLVSSLSDLELNLLKEKIQEVLYVAFSNRGASFKNYKDFGGKKGNFSRSFAVYAQKKDPYGNEVIKEKTPDGRTTHWVPEVQA